MEIVLRMERDAEGDPGSEVKRREEGKALQKEGLMVAKDLNLAKVVLTRRTNQFSFKCGLSKLDLTALVLAFRD